MSIVSKMGQERLAKATQAAGMLSHDVRDLSQADNSLLADVAYTLLDDVVMLHQRLQRLTVLVREPAEG